MFAVINNNIIKNVWWAFTKEEAEADNPGCVCVEVTVDNSPWTAEAVYDGRI